MKIKDILEDYSIHPNIPVKHLANTPDTPPPSTMPDARTTYIQYHWP